MSAPTTEQVKEVANNKWFFGVVSPLVLGFVWFLIDANTTDAEVKPRIEVIEEVLVQQQALNQKFDENQDLNLIQDAQKTIRITATTISRLEKVDTPTPQERVELSTAKAQNNEAWAWLVKIDD